MNRSIVPALVMSLLICCASALGQSGGGYDLTWSTIDGGGGTSSGGGYELTGTIGQPDASNQSAPLSGGDYGLVGGFWVPFGLVCTSHAPFDFDQDCDVDFDDLTTFMACAAGPAIAHGGPPICSPADIDGDTDIDDVDFGAFQRCFSGPGILADPNCAP
ncbi:MAG: hypothetical protein HY718_03595 [Planctomycetes bacterium]|nr:hypothetical protein [Planctomycetota bacterium]